MLEKLLFDVPEEYHIDRDHFYEYLKKYYTEMIFCRIAGSFPFAMIPTVYEKRDSWYHERNRAENARG